MSDTLTIEGQETGHQIAPVVSEPAITVTVKWSDGDTIHVTSDDINMVSDIEHMAAAFGSAIVRSAGMRCWCEEVLWRLVLDVVDRMDLQDIPLAKCAEKCFEKFNSSH